MNKALHYGNREIPSSVRLLSTITFSLLFEPAVGKLKISGQGRTQNMTPLVLDTSLHVGIGCFRVLNFLGHGRRHFYAKRLKLVSYLPG